MKYINNYEKNDWKFWNLKTISVPSDRKIANAIVDFLNNIEPELKCYTIMYKDKLWIVSNDNKLSYINYNYNYVVVVMFYKPELIKFFQKFLTSDVEIRHNCHIYYNGEDIGKDEKGTSIDIPESLMISFIDKLTKENYEQYILEQDSNKYNL